MRIVHRCRIPYTGKSRIEGKIKLIKDQLEWSRQAKPGAFPTAKVFDLDGRIWRLCSSVSERRFLISRMHAYAYNFRRGSLKLPARFNELRSFVSKLTRGQLRRMLWWVKPNISLDRLLSKQQIEFVHAVLPQHIWTRTKENFDSVARSVDTHRLAKKDIPRNPRTPWPSFPSFTEMLEMSRKGITLPGLQKPFITVKDCLTVNQVKRSAYVASSIVSKNVIGVRSNVPMPREFLPWFRYHEGFLILTVRYNIPIGLVRKLLGEWIKCPFNLWLKRPCRFKHYLKTQRLPYERMEILFCKPPAFKTEESAEQPLGTGYLTPTTESVMEARAFFVSLISSDESDEEPIRRKSTK